MIPRGKQAAIQRATECEAQTISSFGKSHPCAAQAAALVVALTAAAQAEVAATIPAAESEPV